MKEDTLETVAPMFLGVPFFSGNHQKPRLETEPGFLKERWVKRLDKESTPRMGEGTTRMELFLRGTSTNSFLWFCFGVPKNSGSKNKSLPCWPRLHSILQETQLRGLLSEAEANGWWGCPPFCGWFSRQTAEKPTFGGFFPILRSK